MSHTRKQRERDFHDRLFGEDADLRAAATKYYTISANARSFYRHLVSLHCNGKQLLNYGCGTGSDSLFWAHSGATVTAIDIAPEAIKKAREDALRARIHVDYHVMDAEHLQFDAKSFDIVAGGGILHHLDLRASYSELSRVLREDGHAIFLEPMGHNPLINLFRRCTPSMRTLDEHPILSDDIQLASHYFTTVEARFFNLFTLVAVPFRNLKIGFDFLLTLLNLIDSAVFSALPITTKYAWMVVLHFSKPKREVQRLVAADALKRPRLA